MSFADMIHIIALTMLYPRQAQSPPTQVRKEVAPRMLPTYNDDFFRHQPSITLGDFH